MAGVVVWFFWFRADGLLTIPRKRHSWENPIAGTSDLSATQASAGNGRTNPRAEWQFSDVRTPNPTSGGIDNNCARPADCPEKPSHNDDTTSKKELELTTGVANPLTVG
jgi:hypothetical protein